MPIVRLPHSARPLLPDRRATGRRGFTLIEMIVVIGILIILMSLVVATVVTALGEMQAAGGASGVAGFLRDGQVKAVQSGKVLGVRADQVFGPNGQTFWQLTAWEYPTNADALLQTVRSDKTNADRWPQGTLPAASFDLDSRQALWISDAGGLPSVPDNINLPAILLLPDGTANRDVIFSVADAAQTMEGAPRATQVELRRSTGRVYLVQNRYEVNP